MRTHSISPAKLITLSALFLSFPQAAISQPKACSRTILAKVAAIDQAMTFNRLGAMSPSVAMFALLRDVQPQAGPTGLAPMSCDNPAASCQPGKVQLRPDKRPRPIALRVNVGDCLDIAFTNLLDSASSSRADGLATSFTGVHVAGLELRATPPPGRIHPIDNDASWVGQNPTSLIPPGGSLTYHYYAAEEGTFFLDSLDDTSAAQLVNGLFGSVTVEPDGAEYYRSQVTQNDLLQATETPGGFSAKFQNSRISARTVRPGTPPAAVQGKPITILTVVQGAGAGRPIDAIETADGLIYTPDGHPIINYQAAYKSGPMAGLPILNMLLPVQGSPNTFEIVCADVTAIITGPGAGRFTSQSPTFKENPVYPDRRQPYREFAIHYHSMPGSTLQAFPAIVNNGTVSAGEDFFGINYASAAIGPEVVANRLNMGPVKDCVECKYEEFFLSSWSLGDPSMIVDKPTCPSPAGCPSTPQPPNKLTPATFAVFPDDPSNVYHSYTRDHVKFRIHNASLATHVHHQHAHQWVHSPDDDNSAYLDSQMIVPGSSYTLEIAYGGSGNRNLTAGDSIFHCHFYPHFAEGMWALWRVHDVFEGGTELQKGTTKPTPTARALPDGEIIAGTPIPAVVPLPTLAMAPIPAKIKLTDNGRRIQVLPRITPGGPVINNPGYPFFIPGMAGHRAPHPPMDFAWEEEDSQPGISKLNTKGEKKYLDGGLPRHLVVEGRIVREYHTAWDFTKDFILYDSEDKMKQKPIAGWLKAFELPEQGTQAERAAMDQHSGPPVATYQPDGLKAYFAENGLPPVEGGPFANPDVSLSGTTNPQPPIRYKAAVVQTDAVLNKAGWHFPQQRLITLWKDVLPMVNHDTPPQPLFFRSESGQSVVFWHTNLVPSYYEFDDFQVRTPTDILGQHIHLVKFDVLASDGAGNGFNYEDGTLSPDDVRDRINAINMKGGLFDFDPKTQWIGSTQKRKTAQPPPPEICPSPCTPPAGQNWLGAQTTVQRWSSDPVENHEGFDRTLRSVFTHDHFGPSTHQQAGLYASLLVEPKCSTWSDPVTGEPFHSGPRTDGGPTSWQANIAVYQNCPNGEKPQHLLKSYREFALEFQDIQLAYNKESPAAPTDTLQTTTPLFTTTNKYTIAAGSLPAGLSDEMATNGIVLSPGATVAATAGGGFEIQDPILNNPGTSGVRRPVAFAKYPIKPTSGSGAVTQQVLTPQVPAGWASAANALFNGGGPFLITQSNTGTYSMNYRSEPLPMRVAPPASPPAVVLPNAQDLSYAFKSDVTRYDPAFNKQPVPNAPIDPKKPNGFKFYAKDLTPGVQPGDPYTPLLRAYENDDIQIRALVGAHMVPHSFGVHGVNWNFEPTAPNSGFRSAQGMGLSEHFEFLFKLPKATTNPRNFADYLYTPSGGVSGLENGLWGILRAYDGTKNLLGDLKPLLTNPNGGTPGQPQVCPANQAPVVFEVMAKAASQILPPGGSLVYNTRSPKAANPNALVFVNQTDLDSNGKLKSANLEPLILRARAGDCIQIKLTNDFDPNSGAFTDLTTAILPAGTNNPGAPSAVTIAMPTSKSVGLHPGLISLDIATGNGVNVGFNPVQTADSRGQVQTYMWYAGNRTTDNAGRVQFTPVEFGSIGLRGSDLLVQPTKGMVGALIIEPAGAQITETTPGSHASAVVTYPAGKPFTEFVTVMQDCVETTGGSCFPTNQNNIIGAINYRSEPREFRIPPTGSEAVRATELLRMRLTNSRPMNPVALKAPSQPAATDLAALFSNDFVKQQPQTRIFTAQAGSPIRFRMIYAGGDSSQVLAIHGHVWQEEPYVNGSTAIGDNSKNSEWRGTQQISSNENFDFVIESAGGSAGVPGDYLYETMLGAGGMGTWGLFRVSAGPDTSAAAPAAPAGNSDVRAAGGEKPADSKKGPDAPAKER